MKKVAVVVQEHPEPFGLGALCEVWAEPYHPDDDNPVFDFVVVTPTPGRLRTRAGFDLVVANLTADVIIPLAADFPEVMPQGSILILSGILREQEEEVKRALERFTWLEAKPENEWVTLVCQL